MKSLNFKPGDKVIVIKDYKEPEKTGIKGKEAEFVGFNEESKTKLDYPYRVKYGLVHTYCVHEIELVNKEVIINNYEIF